MRVALPIDPRLAEIVDKVRAGNLVLVAEPGAGKTTRVPAALLEAGVAGNAQIIVLEPRRLAARLAARFVADECGEKVGERVGYQVRFENVASARTQVLFATEGILTRKLASDPSLRDVRVVVLDEFHERHLHADIALALLRRLQQKSRPDLRIVVMSATLEAERVAAFLDAPVLFAEGKRFDVAQEYLDKVDDRPIFDQVASRARQLLARGIDGDVLVFLPGANEIRRSLETCAQLTDAFGVDIVPLHGDLTPAEQDRAIRLQNRRKIILSTNVAESSVTIQGVVGVVDAGLARVAAHSPWSGFPKLELRKISRASAIQRAGRAGRVRAGFCVRLYTKHDFDTRPMHDAPEIARMDLAETALSLHSLGEPDLFSFPFFENPPDASLRAASDLLHRLGAVHKNGELTELGARMHKLPLHPRAARLVIEADARGAALRGATVAALLGEKDVLAKSRAHFGTRRQEAADVTVTDSDVVARVELLEELEGSGGGFGRARDLGMDGAAASAVLRARDQILRILRPARDFTGSLEDEEEALQIASLAAFPDRVASRVRANSPQIIFALGGGGKIAEESGVKEASLIVAMDADENRGEALVRMASAVKPDWLLELFTDDIEERVVTRFDEAKERVECVTSLAYGNVVLEEKKRMDIRSPEVSACLGDALFTRGLKHLCDEDAFDAFLDRTRFVHEADETFPKFDDELLRTATREFCEGAGSVADLRGLDFLEFLRNTKLTASERGRLDRAAPGKITLPGGRGVKVHYEPGKPPWIESRMQDFFGMKEGPRVADGRVPLVLHLLAPNHNAVQITTDLAGFWDKHYPAIRKELMRQYPRHSWAEDPRTATPPDPNARRRR